MATAYHRDQPGAPELVYSTVGNSIAQFTALKTILKACLIVGYGSRSAAGWELINEDANFIVLRSGSHSGYLCLTYLPSGLVRVYLAETYTGMSGDVMTGDGLKTGTGANNTPQHAFNCYFLARESGVSCWSVVADEKTFVLSITSAVAAAPPLLTSAQNSYVGLTLYVGEDSSGNFIAIGGVQGTGTSYSNYLGDFSGQKGFTALKNPATGLLVDTGSLSVLTPALKEGIASSVINSGLQPLPVATLARMFWIGGGVYAGFLRGLALVSELINTCWVSPAVQALGFPAPMTSRTGSNPIDLGDEYLYFARMGAHNNPMFFLLTDNPEFW